MPDKQVTICISCHNKEKYLSDAVWSALNQVTDVSYEVMVHHDNCGGKGSGANAARNRMIKAVTTPWVLLVDADDMIPSHYLDTLWHSINWDKGRKPNVVIGAPIQFISGCRLDRIKFSCFEIDQYTSQDLEKENPLSISALFKKEMWERLNGFDESIQAMQEWDFWLSAARIGYSIGRTNHTFYLRRDVPGNITNVSPEKEQEYLDAFNKKHGTKATVYRQPYVVPSEEECSIENRMKDVKLQLLGNCGYMHDVVISPNKSIIPLLGGHNESKKVSE